MKERLKNKTKTFNNHSIIYTSKNEEILVSNEDLEFLLNYYWYVRGRYAATRIYKNGKSNQVTMHRILINPPKGFLVDHINLNKLDNRRDNLRIATKSQNNMNKPLLKNNKSGVTGVYWSEKDKLWIASIKINKQRKYLGCFKNKQDAINIRLQAEEKYFGEFACAKEL